MTHKNKVKELVGRGLHSYHTKALQQMDRIEKKNKEQNHKISNLSNELDNDYLTKTEEGSVVSLEHSKEGMIYLDELQGNTLVNYCTDGSKEMTLNGDIDVEGISVTTTEGVDNGKVDVMCEGNTLVNLSNTNRYTISKAISDTNLVITSDTNYLKATTNGEIYNNNSWIYANFGKPKLSLLKPNTKYTVIGDVIKGIGTMAICEGSTVNALTPFSPVKNNRVLLTTNNLTSEINGQILYGWIKNNEEDKPIDIEVKNLIILEGDWTNKEIPSEYFEGMKSVGQDNVNGHKIEILSKNRNLVNCSKLAVKKTGVEYTYKDNMVYINGTTVSNYENSYYVPIENMIAGENYTLSYETNNENKNIAYPVFSCYNNNEKKIIYHTKNTTFTWQSYYSDAKVYIQIDSAGSSFDNTWYKVQLEKNTNATQYVPYNLNKKEISLNEPLRGLPNGIKDRFVKQGGKWYIERNCQKIQVLSTDIVESYRQEENILRQTWTIAFYSNKIPKYTQRVGISNLLPHYTLEDINTKGLIGFDAYTEQRETFNYNTLYVSVTWSSIGILETDSEEQKNKKVLNWLVNNNAEFIIGKDIPTYEEITDVELLTYLDVTHISNNSTIPCNMKIKNSGYNAIIKPSTLYTVALDTNKSGTIGMNLGGVKGTTTNNVLTLTTPATLTDDSLRLYGKGIKGSKVRLLEGDKTNWIPSYFEGMQSSFEDKFDTTDNTYKMEILSNNKNLIDIERMLNKDNYLKGTYSSIKIPLKPNTTYYFKCDFKPDNIQRWIGVFSEPLGFNGALKKTLIWSDSSEGIKEGGFITDKSTDYYLSIYQPNVSYVDDTWYEELFTSVYNNFIISEVDKNYIEGKSNKIQFSSIEPLRGVGNIKDKFVFKDGKLMIERNIGQRIYNGTENWGLYSNKDKVYWISIDEPDGIRGDVGVNRNCYTNKFTRVGSVTFDQEGWSWGDNSPRFYISLSKFKMSEISTNGAKQVLQQWHREGSPLTVTYIKAKPIYEEIPFELQKIILECYENGTLFFDTNIPPTSTITYAGETPIVKSVRLNKTEVLNNTNDINDNIIPYLMDMDYRVVCLQLENNMENISMARLFGGVYEMLKRDIQSKRLTKEEYGYRLADYFNAGKLTEQQVRELEDLR